MLVAALETEVAAYLEAHGDERDDEGHALVVRNGKGRTRLGNSRDCTRTRPAKIEGVAESLMGSDNGGEKAKARQRTGAATRSIVVRSVSAVHDSSTTCDAQAVFSGWDNPGS
jgi:hypothetical protein